MSNDPRTVESFAAQLVTQFASLALLECRAMGNVAFVLVFHDNEISVGSHPNPGANFVAETTGAPPVAVFSRGGYSVLRGPVRHG